MTEYKLFRFVNKDLLNMVTYFSDEREPLIFFNNSYELEKRTGIKTKEEFKTLEEVKVFISLNNSIIELKEQEVLKWNIK